jgi:hypothetical protein
LNSKEIGERQVPGTMATSLKEKVMRFVRDRRTLDRREFVYTESINTPVLYNTLYAVLIWHMYDELNAIPRDEKAAISQYIRSFQDDDGLFRDARIADSPKAKGEGWGWTHLTPHAIMALWALGEKPDKEIKFIEPFYDKEYAWQWLERQKEDLWNGGNAIMYRINMLQCMRDKFARKEAGGIIRFILDFCDGIQDKDTGLYKGKMEYSPLMMTRGVQISYHLWEPYFYENRPLHYIDRIIDSVMATQNSLGGFSIRANSSGCEDIDSIVPLVRLYHLTDYRRKGIEDALERSFKWVMSNMNEDGGFVNMKDMAFEYGHRLMRNEVNQSDLFATWWRSQSLAYLSKVVKNSTLDSVSWKFVNSPGYSFWK